MGEDHSPAQVIKQATETAADQAVDVYRQAVTEALDETRGGLPATSTSYSRLQAAQKALDKLTAQGITGYTDKAGKNWNLASYVEMATRTAVSQRYDDLQNAALQPAGIDLVWTYTGPPRELRAVYALAGSPPVPVR